MKKYLIPLLLTVSTATLAQSSSPADFGLSTYIANEQTQGSLKHFFEQHWTTENYSPIVNINAIASTNTATASIDGNTLPVGQSTSKIAAKETKKNLDNTLREFFYRIYENDDTISKKITAINDAGKTEPFKQYLLDNNIAALTIGKEAGADDTLYVSPDDTSALSSSSYVEASEADKPYIEKPKVIKNANFNFASLITPVAYTNAEKSAANEFLKYAAQSTVDFAKGLNLSQLYSNNQLNVAALLNLKKQSVYQNYQFQLRSLLAVRSMMINTLNHLIAERTPVVGLANAAGIPTLANAPADQRTQIEAEISKLPKFEQEESAKNEASPLQVEAHQANRRIQNPAWYANIENAPPATVQRETLIVLAEIEHQNYEAHLDRERLLAAITAVGLQNNTEATQNMTTEETAKVQAAVKEAIDATKPKTTTSKK